MFRVVPNYVRAAINEIIDKAIYDHPSIETERDRLFHELLDVFEEHGHLNVEIFPKGKPDY